MAVPKRKVSKSRKNKRRSIWRKMVTPTFVECPKCGEFTKPHRVCPSCGYYKDKVVVEVN